MARRWKRWIALLLLMFSATTATANVCSVLATAHLPGSVVTMDCHGGSTTDDDDGTQSEFCALIQRYGAIEARINVNARAELEALRRLAD